MLILYLPVSEPLEGWPHLRPSPVLSLEQRLAGYRLCSKSCPGCVFVQPVSWDAFYIFKGLQKNPRRRKNNGDLMWHTKPEEFTGGPFVGTLAHPRSRGLIGLLCIKWFMRVLLCVFFCCFFVISSLLPPREAGRTVVMMSILKVRTQKPGTLT